MPDTIDLWDRDGGWLIMPRGFALNFGEGMREMGTTVNWTDERTYTRMREEWFTPSEPREWQKPQIEAIFERHQGILKAPAGSGKTVSILLAINRAACKSLIIVNTKDILWQWRDRAKEHLGIEEVGQIGDSTFDVDNFLTIATAQTLHRRFDELERDGFFDEFSFVCLDECFPAGTLISTPSGSRPIESLRVGDVVYGVNHVTGETEPTEVRHTFSRESERLVEVNGLTTTPNHPLFTQRGYVRADEILRSDVMLKWIDDDDPHLLLVPVGVHSRSGPESASTQSAEVLLAPVCGSSEAQVEDKDVSVLRRELRGGEEDDAVLLEVVREQGEDGERREESVGQSAHDGSERAPGRAREDRQLLGVGAQSIHRATSGRDQGASASDDGCTGLEESDETGRAGTRIVGSAGEALEAARVALGTRTHPPHREIGIWLPASAAALLPGGHRAPGEEDRNRSGRPESQNEAGPLAGRAQGGVFVDDRVDADPREERGRAARSTGGPGPHRVYNIETGLGNYFAEGYLVRNCHHATAETYNRILDRFSARFRIGVSATPDKTGDFALATNVLGPIIATTKPGEVDTLIKPEVVKVPTKFGFGFRGTTSRWQRSNYPQMIDALIRNQDRNELIAAVLKQEEGHHGLLISKRLEHLDILEAMMVDADYDGHLLKLTGKEGREERQRVVEIANSEPCLIFSTLADEALDVPRLDRGFLVFPQKNAGLVTQQVGRFERVHPDKKDSRIYDFADLNVGPLEKQFRVRRFEVYEPRGYKITTRKAEDVHAERLF